MQGGEEDIELQQWISEMNNDIRRDADQNNKQLNKIRIVYRKFKTIENLKCEDSPGHQYPPQNNFNKIVIKQQQAHHRSGPILETS